MNKQYVKAIGIVLFTGTLLSGCAAMEKSAVENNENLLTAAGFRMKPADTPEKFAHLKSMQQRKLLTHVQNGSVFYAYADARFCQCLYMGSEKNYQDYERLRIEQNIAEMNQNIEMNQEAAMSWGPWGGWNGWGPWY